MRASANRYCNFHVIFMCTFCKFQLSFYQSHLKTNSVNQRFFSVFCNRLTIQQVNVQTAMAENKEQDTFSNIIYIQFSNCDSFLWGLVWSSGLLRCRQVTWRISVMRFISLLKLQVVGLTLYKIYASQHVLF